MKHRDSPIVKKLVEKGAKFGVHVTGAQIEGKEWAMYPPLAFKWSELFWEAVTKGYTPEGASYKVYPTMFQAADYATKNAQVRRKMVKWNGKEEILRAKMFSYGDPKAYLGDVSLK